MVFQVPFVRWTYARHRSRGSRSRGEFYVVTGDGRSELAGAVVGRPVNHLVYRAMASFVVNYLDILPLGINFCWYLKTEMVAWLNAIIYHSFLRCSSPAVGVAWFMSEVSQYNLTTNMTITPGFRSYFNGDEHSTWILLKHGSKAWAIRIINYQFCDGWALFRRDNGLRSNFKLVFGYERMWIFNVFIFDENNNHVTYPWSSPNPSWINLFPAPGDLMTSRLPSVFEIQPTSNRFGCYYVTKENLFQVLQARLRPTIEAHGGNQFTISIGNCAWIVPIKNHLLHVPTLEAFVDDINLEVLDYLVVSVSPSMELSLLVFDYHNIEKLYPWM